MTNKIHFPSLHSWIDQLNIIPQPSRWNRSLMDIIGIPHHENRWSDIYKFFFSENEEHKMYDLFIRSLEQLIHEEHFLSDFDVKREFVVDKNKRIDLVLFNKNTHRAIIIENKVYHTLNNDLNLYQRSIQKFLGWPSQVKIIVLGLHHYDLKDYRETDNGNDVEDKFSLTHKELLDKVKENIQRYQTDAQPNYVFLLNEFHKNVINMTNQLNPDILRFFCEENNSQRIAEIYRIGQHIEKYVAGIMECTEESQLKDNLSKLHLRCKTERGFVKYIFEKEKELNGEIMLTVFFRDNILSTTHDPHIHMVLEVQGEHKCKLDANREEIDAIVSKYARDGIKFAGKTDEKGGRWIHLAAQTVYDVKNKLPHLGEIMGEYISPSSPIIRLADEIIEKLKTMRA